VSDAGWLTLRELDERAGLPKGSTFRAFKKVAATLVEGRDFRVLDARRDAAEIEPLRQSGRIYRSSVNVILIAAAAAPRIVASGRA
jgi:hypothetical protein